MRHFQKPIENSDPSILTALLDSLSPESRRELVEAAAQSRMLEILRAHQTSTVGTFIQAVQTDPHWSVLQDLPLSEIIVLDTNSAVAEKGDAVTSPQHNLLSDPRQLQLPSESRGSATTAPLATPPARQTTEKHRDAQPVQKATPPTRKSSGDIIDEILMAVTLEPGLRSEELQKRLGKPAVLVKGALAVLRKSRRVRTEGAHRATRYFPPPTKK